MPGALSAVGILLADAVRDYSRTVMMPGSAVDRVEKIFAELERRGTEDFAAEGLTGEAHLSMDLRFRRQGYELNVDYDRHAPARSIAAFHALHRRRYGFADEQWPVEIVNLRLRMVAAGEPYTPAQADLVAGDGCAALVATRDIYFEGSFVPSRIYRREALKPGDALHGPAMITEYTAATVLPPGCATTVDGFGNLIIAVGEERRV
jgi:N-methylhydantoinase A